MHRYQIKLLGVKEANVEVQNDGRSNANIFTDKRYFHLLIPKKEKNNTSNGDFWRL